MAETPGWYPQPFRPDGNIAAEGLRNQLGRPSLSLLTVLARESAQNSWDARTSPEISFTMELGRVGSAHVGAWRSLLGPDMPIAAADDFPLRQTLRRNSITYLAVSDRGTVGLGGPTRSDVPSVEGGKNWLSFVLNSGEARDVEGGGGTYGYGKGIFFLASRVGGILIYSRFREGGRVRSRLIGSVLWRAFTVQGTPFTGRHWWGRRRRDHCEPLEDVAADQVASQLGLPMFSGDETGTTVVIIDPLLHDPLLPEGSSQDLDLPTAGKFLADALAWNLWPITLSGRRERLVPRVIVEGTDIPVPNESTDPAIGSFAGAYRALDDAEQMQDLECRSPRKLVARFAYNRTFGATIESPAARDLGLEGAPHHVALMRRADLVVKYLPGPNGPNPMVGYAGVAKVVDELDETFAQAEPPTHDDWIASQLQGRDATFVRTIGTRLRDRWDELAGVRRQPATLADLPVAGVASALGHLLAGATPAALSSASGRRGARPGPQERPTGGPGAQAVGFASLMGSGDAAGRSNGRSGQDAIMSTNVGRIRAPGLLGPPVFALDGDRTVLEQRVHLPGPGVFEAVVDVLIGDGAVETDAFVGASRPSVLGWRLPDSSRVETASLDHRGGPLEVVLLVDPVEDAAVQITVRGLR